MRKDKAKKLLEILIRETVEDVILAEQTDYSNDVLYKAFIQPFTDILATAQHGAEKIVATALGEIKLLGKQIAYLLVPFIKPEAGSLKNMTAQERKKIAQRLSNIDDKFKEVLDRNWQTFNNPDVWGTLFMMHPQLAIAQKIAVKAPEVALELLSVLTGGSEAVEAILKSYRQMRTGGGRVRYSQSSNDYSQSYGDYGDYMWGDDYAGFDYGMYEQINKKVANSVQRPPVRPRPTQPQQPQQPQQKQSPEAWARQQIFALLKKPEIQKSIAASPITRTMQGEAIKHIVTAAQKDLSFNFAQLKSKLGPDYERALQTIQKKLGLKPEDIEKNQELQKQIVTDIKNMLKPAYIRQLQTLLYTNPAAKRLVDQAIQKVNAL